MQSVTVKELIPEVRRRLSSDDNAPFGDQYISDKPLHGAVKWPQKPDDISQILSAYGERSRIERQFGLEDMTKQFHAEVSTIQDILVEKLGSDIHRRRGSALLAWQNIAMPIRESEKNIIRIFLSDDLYGHPIYDVMPCNRFVQWINHITAAENLNRRKSEKIINGLAISLLVACIIIIGALFG